MRALHGFVSYRVRFTAFDVGCLEVIYIQNMQWNLILRELRCKSMFPITHMIHEIAYVYIYIYIYVCVCVCVCNGGMEEIA